MPWYIVWGHLPGKAQSRTIIADRTPYGTFGDAEAAARSVYPGQSWEIMYAESAQDAVVRAATSPLPADPFAAYASRMAGRAAEPATPAAAPAPPPPAPPQRRLSTFLLRRDSNRR